MPSIEIISVPSGFAPEDLRKVWVGLVLPLITPAEILSDHTSHYRSSFAKEGNYTVLRDHAITALQKAHREYAADRWDSLDTGRYLFFPENTCKLIKE